MTLIQRTEKQQLCGNYRCLGLWTCPRGADVKDVGENETVRDKDGNTGQNYIDACHEENYHIIDVGTCAGELEQREDVTEIMVDGVCITEGQTEHASSVSHAQENAIK